MSMDWEKDLKEVREHFDRGVSLDKLGRLEAQREGHDWGMRAHR